MIRNELVAVDLFCGIGGLTYGLQQAGIKVVAGIDNDASCRYAYETNNHSKFIEKDIVDFTGEELNKLYPKNAIKVLVGCSPCQTFSQHTIKKKIGNEDERMGLLYEFLRLVKESKPDFISMENVPRLRNYPVFQDFVNGLRDEGYYVYYRIVNCPRYGIPQKRVRLVLLAARDKIELIPETHEPSNYMTIKQVIGNLPHISAGGISEVDTLHRARKLSIINKRRIKQSKQGGTWLDWDKELRLKCHKKRKGVSYKSVYGRMRWDSPSPTITTQFYSYGTGRFGHPSQNRAISLREGAILQTFPKDYEFCEEGCEIYFAEIGRHIGNAVPTKLGEVIGLSIKNHARFDKNG